MDFINLMIFIAVIFAIFAVTVIFLVICLNKKDKQFNTERTDYLNRIMAKNTPEYVTLSKQSKPEKPKILTDADILGDDRYDGILN